VCQFFVSELCWQCVLICNFTAVQNSSEVKLLSNCHGHFERRFPDFRVQAPIIFRAQPVRLPPDAQSGGRRTVLILVRPAICADKVVLE
jgi:hypothetical protein